MLLLLLLIPLVPFNRVTMHKQQTHTFTCDCLSDSPMGLQAYLLPQTAIANAASTLQWKI
jgi:hypothetical protein